MMPETSVPLFTHLVADGDEGRIQAWDPIIKYIIKAAQWWGTEKYNTAHMNIVDEGYEKVMDLAVAYQDHAWHDERIEQLVELINNRFNVGAVVEQGEIGYSTHVYIELMYEGFDLDYIMLGFDVDNPDNHFNGYLTVIGCRNGYPGFDSHIELPNMFDTETVLEALWYTLNHYKNETENI